MGLVSVLLVAELAVRGAAAHLPEPQVWSTPETQYKVEQMAGLGPVETVFTGSSVVDVGVDPSLLDRPAYNGALGAASIGMVADFTLGHVVPQLDPATVVVGLSSRELNPNSPEQQATEEAFRDAPAVRRMLGTESVLDRLQRTLGDVSHVVRYRSVLRDPGSWLDGDPSWDDRLTRRDGLYLGFLDEPYRAPDQLLRRLRAGALHDFAIGDGPVATLRDLLTELREDGRQVLLVATPVTQDYVEAHPHGARDHDQFTATIAALARDLDIPLLSSGVWDTSFMADPLHVNRAGAARLSRAIRQALR